MEPGHPTFVPLQAIPIPQAGLPAVPWRAGAQVPSADEPSAAVQTSHWEAHAVWQQTPSARAPLTHAAAEALGCPFLSAHALAPLQVELLGQLACGSVLTRDAAHVPLVPPGAWRAAAQAWQAGHVAVPQQTPSKHDKAPVHSRQLAPKQSPPPAAGATLHEAPWAFCGWQVPPLPQ